MAGALAFDAEYARWLDDHNRHMNELRSAVNAHAGDTELRTVVDSAISQFNELYRLKGTAAKADVFHILSGMWKTPAERCFIWIGDFRSSELLKVIILTILSWIHKVDIFQTYLTLFVADSGQSIGAFNTAATDGHLQPAAVFSASRGCTFTRNGSFAAIFGRDFGEWWLTGTLKLRKWPIHGRPNSNGYGHGTA